MSEPDQPWGSGVECMNWIGSGLLSSSTLSNPTTCREGGREGGWEGGEEGGREGGRKGGRGRREREKEQEGERERERKGVCVSVMQCEREGGVREKEVWLWLNSDLIEEQTELGMGAGVKGRLKQRQEEVLQNLTEVLKQFLRTVNVTGVPGRREGGEEARRGIQYI